MPLNILILNEAKETGRNQPILFDAEKVRLKGKKAKWRSKKSICNEKNASLNLPSPFVAEKILLLRNKFY
jgi:hypothetical protein